MTNKNNYFDTTTIILLGLLVLLLVFSIPLFMNNSKINNITRDLDIIETFSNCGTKQHFSNKEQFAKLKRGNDKFTNPHPPKVISKPNNSNKEGFTTDDTKLELYTMAGCGHCVNFKTIFEIFHLTQK